MSSKVCMHVWIFLKSFHKIVSHNYSQFITFKIVFPKVYVNSLILSLRDSKIQYSFMEGVW
jgi:hypothetical protein